MTDHTHPCCDAEIAKLRAEAERLEMIAWMEQIADLQASLKKVCSERDQLRAEVERLRQRVSPVTEPCQCPEFCTYHARSNFESTKLQVESLRNALVARRAMESYHSREDHKCHECALLADMQHSEKQEGVCPACGGRGFLQPFDGIVRTTCALCNGKAKV